MCLFIKKRDDCVSVRARAGGDDDRGVCAHFDGIHFHPCSSILWDSRVVERSNRVQNRRRRHPAESSGERWKEDDDDNDDDDDDQDVVPSGLF